MSVYVSPNYTRKKEEYGRNDSVILYLFYYFKGEKLRIPTNLSVKIKDWDEDYQRKKTLSPVLKSDPEHISKNILLKQKISEVHQVIDRIKFNKQIPVISLVKNHLDGLKRVEVKKTYQNLDLLFLLEEYKDYVKNEITFRKGYQKSIQTSIARIEEFTIEYNKNLKFNILVSDIDEEYQKSFLKYYSDKEDQPSTIRKRLKSLVSFVNWCNKKDYTDHKISVIGFNHDFEKDVIYLTREEVLKLYNFKDFDYDNPNHKKYTHDFFYDTLKNGKRVTYTNLEVYKDVLVFGSGIGCRFGDLINLKLDNYQFSDDRTKGFFVFRMEKSKMGKQVKVPINRLTFEIWKKYSKNKQRTDFIFPKSANGNPVSNQKMNKSIKDIGEIVGLDRLVSKPKFNVEGKVVKETDTRVPLHSVLTTHIMRRTFIREGIENKIPTHIMMSMSGHSTEKVFRRYFSTTNDELDEEGSKLFSLELKSEEAEKSNETKPDLESELKRLKDLFDKGLLPESVYLQKINELV